MNVAKTESGQALVMFPRLNTERVQTSELISEVLKNTPQTYEEGDFMFEEVLNG